MLFCNYYSCTFIRFIRATGAQSDGDSGCYTPFTPRAPHSAPRVRGAPHRRAATRNSRLASLDRTTASVKYRVARGITDRERSLCALKESKGSRGASSARVMASDDSAPSTSARANEGGMLPTDAPWGTLGRQAVLSTVALVSKFLLDVVNSTTTTNGETLRDAITSRERPQGLITLSNHASTFDDPGVLSELIPMKYFLTEPWHGGVRWTLCTDEICAKNKLREDFFLCGKALAIKRGGGLDQPVLHTAVELVKRGDWLHLFPEGRVSRDGELSRMRRGFAKLLCDIENSGGQTPLVVPFWHSGMAVVKPYGEYSIGVGKRVHVTVGEPIDFSDLVKKCGRCEKSVKARDALYGQIMDRVEGRLRDLKAKNARERESTGAAVN